MGCRILHISDALTAQQRDAVHEVLAEGGLIVFPTETFYGVAALPSHAGALERLARLKERERDKPIPLIAASREDVSAIADIPVELAPLARAFWPGPLTLALPPKSGVAPELLGSGSTVGIRISSYPVARDIASAAGGVVTSTSANFSGEAPPADVEAMSDALKDAVDLMLDAGSLTGGAPSTVVGIVDGAVHIFREGAISRARIAEVLR